MRFWNFIRKRETNNKITQAKESWQQAHDFFIAQYHIEPEQAMSRIEGIHKEIRDKELDIAARNADIAAITETMEAIKHEYQRHKISMETRADNKHTAKLLKGLKKSREAQSGETEQEKLSRARSERKLDITTKADVKRTIGDLHPSHMKILQDNRK